MEACRKELRELRVERGPEQEGRGCYKLPKPTLKKLEEGDDIEASWQPLSGSRPRSTDGQRRYGQHSWLVLP